MFYLAVEEHVMQNRQRELVKELKLKRKLWNSFESKSDNGSYFLVEVGGRLRNLTHFFKTDTNEPTDVEMSLDCVVC